MNQHLMSCFVPSLKVDERLRKTVLSMSYNVVCQSEFDRRLYLGLGHVDHPAPKQYSAPLTYHLFAPLQHNVLFTSTF